jgi:hypothetical protein
VKPVGSKIEKLDLVYKKGVIISKSSDETPLSLIDNNGNIAILMDELGTNHFAGDGWLQPISTRDRTDEAFYLFLEEDPLSIASTSHMEKQIDASN